MPPKPAQNKKKPAAAQQKKKATKTTKGNKDKAKGGNKGKTTKPVKKKPAAATAATKAAKDAAPKGAATGAAAGASRPVGKGNGEASAQTRAETLPEVRDAPDQSWMRDHPNGADDDCDPEAEGADNEEEEEDDEIAQYIDKLEARVLSTLSDLPYHLTSITETVRNAFRQHRRAMPIPEAALPHLSGALPPGGVPPRYQRARYDLSSGTPSSVPTMSGWSSRTGTFLNEEFGRSGRWETMEEETGDREEDGEGTGGGRRQVLTEEELYRTIKSYSAEIRRELSCRLCYLDDPINNTSSTWPIAR